MKTKFILSLMMLSLGCLGQSKLAPKFNLSTMQFEGTKAEQAKYLLRKVGKYGNLGKPLDTLPSFLNEALENTKKVIPRELLLKYLAKASLTNDKIGGNINDKIVTTSKNISANYIVFHDVSHLLSKTTSFPDNINTSSWRGNNLERYNGFKNAHLFVNRIGDSYTSNDFSKVIQGTKFESKTKNPICGGANNGDFIHIELIQPRISDAGRSNDANAPVPGFSDLQYTRLALVYIAASSRKGEWLVPAFHAVVDEGIPDAHDDPQNFDLATFSRKLETLYTEINSD